jgi:entericidin B
VSTVMMRRHVLAALALALSVLALSACQTVEGFGRDVQSGGEAVEDTARDVRGY